MLLVELDELEELGAALLLGVVVVELELDEELGAVAAF